MDFADDFFSDEEVQLTQGSQQQNEQDLEQGENKEEEQQNQSPSPTEKQKKSQILSQQELLYCQKLIQTLPLHSENVVLIFPGNFYPIHDNHLGALELAKQIAIVRGMNVLGAFLFPFHNNLVKQQIQTYMIDAKHRASMLHLATQQSDWISVYDKVLLEKNNLGFSSGLNLINEIVTSFYQIKLNQMEIKDRQQKRYKFKLVSVFGIDNFNERTSQMCLREQTIFVENRPRLDMDEPFDINTAIDFFQLNQVKENVIYIKDEMSETVVHSSELREMFKDQQNFDLLQQIMNPGVFQYHLDNKIFYTQNKLPATQLQPVQPAGPINELLNFEVPQIQWSDLESENKQQGDILGKGLQAKVFKMQLLSQGEDVAVKMFDLKSERGKQVKTISRQLRSLAACNHSNVVGFKGAGTHETLCFIVLELGTGKHDRKNWKNFDDVPAHWFASFSLLAQGCHNMSTSGVLHRDLQVNNILVFEREGKQIYQVQRGEKSIKIPILYDLKVCDFGVSAFEDDQHSIIRGSTRHYAPEAIQAKEKYIPASDVYSFGNIIYEILHIKHIFCDSPVSVASEQILKGERPIFKVKIDPEFQKIVDLCWEHDSNQRPTFKQVSQLIDDYVINKFSL